MALLGEERAERPAFVTSADRRDFKLRIAAGRGEGG